MIKNAKTLPKVYYGLHMEPGLAEYKEPEKAAYRILVGEAAIKNMDPTFGGKPVYVNHVDEVDLENLQKDADGYVMESFFNKADGKHWVKFIAVSDRAHEAIRNGWRLSNAYVPKKTSGGGIWHGMDYEHEVLEGEYEHLAIVQNPRYENSVIMTPEQFKTYNGQKEAELMRHANSLEGKGATSMLKLFKKTKVENAADFDSMSVTLPKSGIEMTLTEVVNELDAIKNMSGYANGDHMVKAGDDEMSVNDMVSKYMEMKKNADEADEKGKKENAESDEEKAKAEKEKKENEDKEAEAKKQNALEAKKATDAELAKKKAENDKIENANKNAAKPAPQILMTADKVKLGKELFG